MPTKKNNTTKTFVALFVILISSINTNQLSAQDKIGVLVLAHGSPQTTWDNAIENSIKPIKKKYTTEIAFGMANPISMQSAIDKLERKGVDTIIVVQLFVSSYSPIIRQNEYLLGLRDSLADAPMLMMHHAMAKTSMEGNEGKTHHNSQPQELAQLDIKTHIILTKPLDDHALVADILFDRIQALSKNPSNETVLIVAHGPNSADDNEKWVSVIESLGNQIKRKQALKGQGFKDIKGLTVRDDADPEIYEKAKQSFRNEVIKADEKGDAIVIPLLLSQGGVESRYLKRLEGLNFIWSGETLLPHPNVSEFIKLRVENALSQE